MNSKFKIVSLKMVGKNEYKSTIDNDICNICKYNINGNSIFNITNTITEIVEGDCGHSYHSDCLKKMPTKNCATCCTPWIIKKIIDN